MEENEKIERFYGTARLEDYTRFVDEVTSKDTKSHSFFKENLDIVKEKGVQPSRLLCAAVDCAYEKRTRRCNVVCCTRLYGFE